MGSELICGICDSVHDAKLVYDHRWMSIEMAQQLRKKFEREQPQGEATLGEGIRDNNDYYKQLLPRTAQTEGGEKPREIFVGPPDRLETALDVMGVDPLSQGTFTCDICGNDVPHSHEPAEVETERYIRPAFKKTTVPRQAWAQLEAHGPYLEPLTDQLFKHFASGWVAAKRHYQWMCDETIGETTKKDKRGRIIPDGSLRPHIRKTIERAERAEKAWQAAIQAERERCAKIADEFQCSVSKIGAQPKDIADAIRRGGEHEHNE